MANKNLNYLLTSSQHLMTWWDMSKCLREFIVGLSNKQEEIKCSFLIILIQFSPQHTLIERVALHIFNVKSRSMNVLCISSRGMKASLSH